MQQPISPSSPGDPGQARRRGLFSGKAAASVPPYVPDPRLEATLSAYQMMIQDRLEEGIRAIQHTANTLMHEIAGEVWRTAGGDKDEVQARILETLSRDQALRGLIAHSDERFQALTVRTARLEDTLNQVAEQTRSAKEALARGADALVDAANAPALRGVDDIRERLDQVTHQIALAFETLAERDRAIVETVQAQVREHGEVVMSETGRIAQAMQAYVQEGVSVLGNLAGNVESQMEAITARDDDISARIDQTVEEQMRLLGEQLQLITESITHQTEKNDERIEYLSEHLQLMHDRIGMETRDTIGALERIEGVTRETAIEATREMNDALEARVMGLAQLVRSDSEALRGELVRSATERDESLGRTLDEQLGRVSEALTSATRWTVEEMTRRIREETARAVQGRLDDAVDSIDKMGQRNQQIIQGSLNDAMGAIDRNMVRMADTLDTELDRLARNVGDRASIAAETAVDRFGTDTFDKKISALAKMIRSDNQALAERLTVAADQDAAKQALRAVKELQAQLPAEVNEVVERRIQEMTESIAGQSEMLARKIEQMGAHIGQRYDDDIQIVIERMGDAMHALASLSRPAGRPDRIELE